MSKTNQVSMIEQHLEKVVLAVVVLLLGFSLLRYVISSPRKVQLAVPNRGNEQVDVADVDRRLAEAVSNLEYVVERAQEPSREVPDYRRQVQALRSPQLAWSLPVIATPMPSVDAIGPDVEPIALAALEEALPAPSINTIVAARELPNWANGEEVNAAHVVALFPWQQLQEGRWPELLQKARVPAMPLVVGVEAQVQTLQEDGTWSEPVAVRAVMPVDEDGQPMTIPEIPRYEGRNSAKVTQALATLGDQLMQLDILQPEFFEVWWAGQDWIDWKTKLPKTEVTLAWEKEQAEPKEAEPKIAMASKAPASSRRSSARGAARGGVGGMANVGDMMAMAMAMEGGDEEESYSIDPGAAAASRRQSRDEAAKKRAEEAAKGPDKPEVTFVPDLDWQKQLGQVLVWLHDVSLEAGRTYRYRLRLKLSNPLLTYTNSVLDEQDAREPYVHTPYSDWSESVRVPQVTEFFVTGGTNDAVRVAVFTRVFGQQVVEQFTVSPGEPIGGSKTMSMTHPSRMTSETVRVDFDTKAVAVGMDLNKTGLGTYGNRAVELLYLDDQGKLNSVVDINHMPRNAHEWTRYKQLEDEIKLAKKAALAAAATQ